MKYIAVSIMAIEWQIMSQASSDLFLLSKNHFAPNDEPHDNHLQPQSLAQPASRPLNHYDACGICKRDRQGREVRGRGNPT